MESETMEADEMEYYMPGDIIYESPDFQHVIFHKFHENYCDHCRTRNLLVKLCLGCEYVAYCNRECQMSAWPEHKEECKNRPWLYAPPESNVDIFMLLVRVIRKLQTIPKASSAVKVGSHEVVMKNLTSFLDASFGSALEASQEYLLSLACHLQHYLADINSQLPKLVTIQLCNQILYNKGTLNYDKEYGLFFSIGRSFFQHSCLPNAVDIFSSQLTHQIRATKKIPKGDLTKVHLPCLNMVESFCKICSQLSDNMHLRNLCQSCKPSVYDSPLSTVIQEDSAYETIFHADLLVHEIIESDGIGNSNIRNKVDKTLKEMRNVLGNTHLLRLKLVVWKILLDHHKLYDVKCFERNLIHLIRTLHGEQSYELFSVYHHLAAIFAKYGKLKVAKLYQARRDEIGCLYGLAPLYSSVDTLIEEYDTNRSAAMFKNDL